MVAWRPRRRCWRRLLLGLATTVVFAAGLGAMVGARLRLAGVDERTQMERILRFRRQPCGAVIGVGASTMGEGTRQVRCRNGRSYVLAAQLPCSESWLCQWLDAACWDVL
jgi:hypothetical protein